jgi:hypothetical protein
MTRPARAGTFAAAVVMLGTSCTVSAVPPAATTPPISQHPARHVVLGNETATEAARELCDRPKPQARRPAENTGPTPAAIAEVEQQIQQVRHLQFVKPVPVEPLTQTEIGRRVDTQIGKSFPQEEDRRRTRAWQTIGVLPSGTDLQESVRRFAGGQVVGFYVPTRGALVFAGSEEPDALGKVTLAHELTHALDDQHFDLTRLDQLDAACRDEEATAALGAVEGSAQYFSFAYAKQFLSLTDLASAATQNIPSTEGIPPFVVQLEIWPYTAGLAFMTARADAGGIDAINAALRRLPVSTEQVLHPDRYPSDLPRAVDVADLGPALGRSWNDLDVMDVGEAWLRIMLDLRLDDGDAELAAAGWDGGQYRAWSDGRRTAVVLDTTWDGEGNASQFADAMGRWIADGSTQAFVEQDGTSVSVGFASESGVLARERVAVAAAA